jgi:hypothetical protein
MIKGHKFGRLTAIQVVGRADDGHLLWLCSCDCGNSATVQSSSLKRENGTKSCGCLRKEAALNRVKKEGIWNDGKSYSINCGERCYKTRHAWAKAAIRKYGNKCQLCGWNKGRCDVHHRILKSQGGLHLLENAIVVCPNCHRVEHEKRVS